MSETSSIPGTVTLVVNTSSANLILTSLAQQPWQQVNQLIIDLRQQITRQVNPRPAE